MRTVKDLLFGVEIEAVQGSTEVTVCALAFDSRKVTANTLFVAIKGGAFDGHDFIDQAIANGAGVVVCEAKPISARAGVVWVVVKNTRKALAIMASHFFDNPSKKIKLVGVTGTNGKTSVTTLLYGLFLHLGYPVGLLSTIAVKYNGLSFSSTHTTPDPIQINARLAEMVQNGVDYCFMEVSSHGISQERTEGLTFAGGVFANLTHDHLDYHGSFAAYRDIKKQFFDQLPAAAFALTNIDDKNGDYMLQNCRAQKRSYALKNYGDYTAKILEKNFEGMLLSIADQEVWTALVGSFNASNLLAVYGVAQQLGVEKQTALTAMSVLKNVDGRFETIVTSNKAIVIVDYAHTPDALKNVLQTIADIRTRNEVLTTVVGCGGNRDVEKRPLMAQVAVQLSDQVILTSDNPRNEDPEKILDDMEAGISPDQSRKTLRITDRKAAIKAACMRLNPADVLLIAGKGHEKFQEVKGIKTPFDDIALVKEFCNASA